MLSKLYQHVRRTIFPIFYKRRVRKQASLSGSPLKVNRLTSLNKNTKLGDNVHFNGLEVIGPGTVIIGDNFHSGSGCKIRTQTHNYDSGDAIPYGNDYVVEKVVIENNVWLGENVTILPGITIGEGAIVQTGSVVVSDVPECAIVGGHPAEVFDYRDRDHYEMLKEEGKFH